MLFYKKLVTRFSAIQPFGNRDDASVRVRYHVLFSFTRNVQRFAYMPTTTRLGFIHVAVVSCSRCIFSTASALDVNVPNGLSSGVYSAKWHPLKGMLLFERF